VRGAVERLHATNRDAHNVFAQLGMEIGWLSEELIADACISLWISEHKDEVNRIAEAIKAVLAIAPVAAA
jgi:hypothetical protein